jgi:ketosteroid isomerase-like protein
VRERLEDWVRRYVRAWNTNDPDDIRALFTDDAVYYTAPFREPWRGSDGIVAGWLERKDEPGDSQFEFEVIAIDGDLGFVRGETYYKADDERFANLWEIRLDGDRCSAFTEWWMEVH